MKVSELLREAGRRLDESGIDESELDARLLLEFATGMTRTQLILRSEEQLDPELENRFIALIDKRSERIPLHYLTESREFWSLDFIVSPAVLIPRPETEFLLEQIIASVQPQPSHDFNVLDMCTGSGVIGAVLERELHCRLTAVDISTGALAVAKTNFSRHCRREPFLICSDLFTAIRNGVLFDLVVSNPPYICQHELASLQPEVIENEPLLALDGGKSGVEIIYRILEAVPHYLKKGGWLFMEIGDQQKNDVLSYISNNDQLLMEADVLKDWAGRDRVLKARYGYPPSP